MIKRELEDYAKEIFKYYPVLTITGPRQSGKTILARTCFGKDLPYVNLEAPDMRRYALDDPRAFLADYPHGAILDEIQRVPELTSYIQVLVDELKSNSLFVLTGSHQFELHESVSQSLSGRTTMLKLLPLTIRELLKLTSKPSVDDMLLKGFLPRIFDQKIPFSQALSDYMVTYIQRDLRQLIQIKNLDIFDRFLGLCAGRVGQVLNLSNLGNDVGVSHTTIREWISLLQASYIIFLLPPYHRNVGKRLIKSPKLYFYDVGMATHLLGIHTPLQLKHHPLRGSLFENMIIAEALKHQVNQGKKPALHFYRDSSGHEVDLLYQEGPDFLPIEIKSGQTIANSFFKGLHTFKKVEPQLPFGRMLVYGGTRRQTRQDIHITTPFKFASDLHQVCNRNNIA